MHVRGYFFGRVFNINLKMLVVGVYVVLICDIVYFLLIGKRQALVLLLVSEPNIIKPSGFIINVCTMYT